MLHIFKLLGNAHIRKEMWYQLCTLYAVFVLEFGFVAVYFVSVYFSRCVNLNLYN